MKKIIKIMLAIIAGIDVTIVIFTPMFLATIWVSVFGFKTSSYFIYGLAFLATLFRAIKIGWMK